MYLLRLSLRPWRIALGSQVFTVAAMGFLLMLGGALYWLQSSLTPVIQNLQGEQVVTLYLDQSVPAGAEPGIVNQVQDAMSDQVGSGQRMGQVKVSYLGTSEFLEQLKEKYPQLAADLQTLGSDQTQVIPRTISVVGSLSTHSIDRLRKVEGIESLEAARDRYVPVISTLKVLQWVIRLLMIGLTAALLTGLVHLARMNAYLHQDAVSLLRLWGAGESTVQAPGLISGLGVGAMGGALAWVAWSTLGLWIAQQLQSLTPLLDQTKIPSALMGLGFVFVGALLGMVSGWIGANWMQARNGNRVIGGGNA